MRYWYDTEFIENGDTIRLLSIGMLAEDERELYLENKSTDLNQASQWVRSNVLPHLTAARLSVTKWHWADSPVAQWHSEIAKQVALFCDPEKYGKPEFWGYYSAYDHVALCQLFGTMMQLPKGWPMYTRDIKQLADYLGNPTLPEQGKKEHHALADARWNRRAWEFLLPLRPVVKS